MDFVGNLLFFRAVNFENPLRIDKVMSCVWCTTFLGHSVHFFRMCLMLTSS